MSASSATAKTPPLRRRRWLRVVGWSALLLVLVAGAAALWAWTQRYSLIERQAIAYLDQRGIDASLRIDSATRTRAQLRNIRLSADGETFLQVERLSAEYQWRDLLEGRVERLDVAGVDASLTLDERGRITDSWMPSGTGGGAGAFPARGLGLARATVRLDTPFGRALVEGDAEARSPEQLEFSGRVELPELSRDGVRLSLSGPVEASRDGADLRAQSPSLALSLLAPQGRLQGSTAAVDALYNLQSREARGTVTLTGGAFEASAGVAGEIGEVSASGAFAADAGATAAVDAELQNVRVTDAERRAQIARTLSLRDALGDVPVARNFAPQITEPMAELLAGSDVSGAFSLALDKTGRTLALRGPLTVSGRRTTLRLTAAGDVPLYRYKPEEAAYRVHASAALDRPLPLSLLPIAVTVRSDDGLSVGGVAAASGRVRTRSDWQGRSPDGVAARLGPLDVAFDYTAPLDTPAQLTLRGSANYSGDVPGGIVGDLAAGGRMTAALRDGRPSVSFAPSGPIRFARLDTVSDWALRDFEGALLPSGPLYRRLSGNSAAVQTGLAGSRFVAERSAEAEGGFAELSVTLGSADLSGTVRSATQDWTVEFADAALQSDTFPVAGTDLVLPSGTVEVGLSEAARTTFALSAPSSVLTTPGYVVRDMALEASGTAEAYEMRYRGGRVRLIATDPAAAPIPVMPATGVLRFEGGVFTGEAQSSLPRAEEQPFSITYRLEDGRGTADVTIRDLVFAPRRLQPQDLVPALKGKISLVEGAIDADLDVQFGGGLPPTGTGTVDLKGLSLGTAPGPVSGLRGTVALTSLFPVVTAPDQRMSVELFDPGVPLRDGNFRYQLVEGGIEVASAVWPLGDGQVGMDPFTWVYAAEENRVTLRVSGVEVGEFLDGIGGGQLSATGELTGAIPVVVRGLDVLVEGGRVEVVDGGYIRYKPKPGNDIASRVPNRFAADALKALENFRYNALFAELNGPLGGEVRLGMSFTGTNEDVLYGVPFAFDVSVEGELFNIARSFNTNATIKRAVGSAVAVVE